MHTFDYLVYIFLLIGVVLSIKTKKLTVKGALTGGIIGVLVYEGAGFCGIAMLAVFFLSGSTATGWQLNKKLRMNVAEKRKGQRTAGQVLANGGIAAMCGAISWYSNQLAGLMQLMMAGSLAAAIADTLSSELGVIYGRNFYDVISFKKVQPGPDGVISLEGTLIGIAGAILIATIYALGFGFNISFVFIVIAGAIGNLSDSVIGATLERRQWIGNNTVNFLNTFVGGMTCFILGLIDK
ncbi:DUF92 domain-containing protein [Mucilaginibacter sp.]|uniref:DUF92 domain-containing protein n=1 Tax=Mucilaginibacter sp. TaxID=1882438 RepID=UPI003D0FB7F6